MTKQTPPPPYISRICLAVFFAAFFVFPSHSAVLSSKNINRPVLTPAGLSRTAAPIAKAPIAMPNTARAALINKVNLGGVSTSNLTAANIQRNIPLSSGVIYDDTDIREIISEHDDDIKYILAALKRLPEANDIATKEHVTEHINFVMNEVVPNLVTLEQLEQILNNHTPQFATPSQDYPKIYTWNGAQLNLPETYNGRVIKDFGGVGQVDLLVTNGIYPEYWVQAMCSHISGSAYVVGKPTYANDGGKCWCRLKRRHDNKNGNFIFYNSYNPVQDCAYDCPKACSVVAISYTPQMISAFNSAP